MRRAMRYETAFWTSVKLGALTVLAPTHAARGFVLQPFLTAENDLRAAPFVKLRESENRRC
jgi:hypothetical protein